MKTETPVDRDKEAKKKEEKERLTTAFKGCFFATLFLLACLFLLVALISILIWTYHVWGFWVALIVFGVIGSIGIGIFFGVSIYLPDPTNPK